MLRSLTGIGIALALVGSAHAQDQQISVSLQGKSRTAIRTELYRAAEKVCSNTPSALDPLDADCVQATYDHALRQARSLFHAGRTGVVEAAYSAR